MILLGVGTNLDSKKANRLDNLKKTIELIVLEKIKILQISSVYETPSYPDKKKPKFLNIIIEVSFGTDFENLLKKTLLIEKKMGRVRKFKNEPRVCDIDIIDFNGLVLTQDNIILPHPRAHERNFVLYPIQEIIPLWKHPKNNKEIGDLIGNLKSDASNEITRLKERVIFNK